MGRRFYASRFDAEGLSPGNHVSGGLMEAGEPTKRKSRASLLEFPIQLLRQDLCLVGKIEGPEEILSRQCVFGIG